MRVARDYDPELHKGTICDCGAPKWITSKTCRECWRISLFREHAVRCGCDPCRRREADKRHERRVRSGELKGTPTGRPQPPDHPWRVRRA